VRPSRHARQSRGTPHRAEPAAERVLLASLPKLRYKPRCVRPTPPGVLVEQVHADGISHLVVYGAAPEKHLKTQKPSQRRDCDEGVPTPKLEIVFGHSKSSALAVSACKDILSQTDTDFGAAAQSERRKVNMAIVKIIVLPQGRGEKRSSTHW
jgi:hypothetical protein